tara:strand:- start:58 stop:465 length:408 start_codon:yes stop_codon:yes gene_type:complete
MDKKMRTLIAHLIAPAIVSLILAALHFGYGLEGMVVMLFGASLFTFPVSGGIAIISHFVLKKLNRINVVHYFLAGALAASPMTILGNIGVKIDFVSLMLPTLTGGLVGIFVIIIQRPKDPSRRSDQLRYGSASTT